VVLMANGIFITGTDTSVGKTLVACGLAVLLRDSGYRVGVMKPAETGCPERNGKLFPQDAAKLKEASGCKASLDTICPYSLGEPLAPSVAAERSGRRIDIDRLIDAYHEISLAHDVTLVEGAGGLMVPLLPSYTYADLAYVLKLPVIVVAANRLGMINHLLLTLEHASCKELRVLGYVLNQIENPPSLAAETNPEALFTMTAAPCLGEIPYLQGVGDKEPCVADRLKEQLGLRFLTTLLE
jgi:dethiobiotin synthetase